MVVQEVKPLLATPASHSIALARVPTALLPISSQKMCLEKQQGMAQVPGPLLHLHKRPHVDGVPGSWPD